MSQAQAVEPKLEITTSRQFTSFLAECRASIAVTTYQGGKLFLFGLQPNGRLSVFERTLERCMGMAYADGMLHVATLWQVWRFANTLPKGDYWQGHDALFAPRVGWVTGDLDVHDIGVLAGGRPAFANTLFSCVATVSETHSFTPLWRPNFISRLAAEDRCHLNGLAMEDGQPAYVSMVGPTDVADGWRDHRRGGGQVMDVRTGEVVAGGLSMPHSPRLREGKLYLLNSGTGEFGWIDRASGRFEPICFCPGYLRGLSFIGGHALVGLSLPRDNRTFTGLALDGELARRKAEARCAVMAINLRTGDIDHWLRFEGFVQELYDVTVLPDIRRPAAIGFKSDEVRRVLSLPD